MKNKAKLQSFINNYQLILNYLKLVRDGMMSPEEVLENCESNILMDVKISFIMAGYITK